MCICSSYVVGIPALAIGSISPTFGATIRYNDYD